MYPFERLVVYSLLALVTIPLLSIVAGYYYGMVVTRSQKSSGETKAIRLTVAVQAFCIVVVDIFVYEWLVFFWIDNFCIIAVLLILFGIVTYWLTIKLTSRASQLTIAAEKNLKP
jgi:hypothetical protein